ncbi:hypothetical protein FRC06_004269, partial [Ceratobasidium sp. 370]
MVNVLCIGIAVEDHKSFPHTTNDPWVNPTLVRHSYLSPSPHQPWVAFAIALLELLTAVQRRGLSMSIQVMAKVFCDLRNVPYETHFRTQLMAALDVYLLIESLAVIERVETSISHLALDVPLDKLKGVLELEEHYLNVLKAEDPEDTMAVEYIELREHLEAAQAEYDKHQKLFISYNPSSGDLQKAATMNRIEAQAPWTMNQIFTLRQAVTDFEEKHGISIPWTREMKEWVDADDIRCNRDVQQCIDSLEQLSVQRIFEMSSAGICGLGYKMHMHIMQAINNHSAALKSALKRYNDAASKVRLQAISWETLTSISMLADFDLLPEEYQHIMHAKEEILQLNVQVNNNIMHELNILMHSKQYMGLCDTGVQLGRQVDNGVAQPPAQSPSPDTPQNNIALEGSMLASQLPATLVDEEGMLCDAADVSVDDE